MALSIVAKSTTRPGLYPGELASEVGGGGECAAGGIGLADDHSNGHRVLSSTCSAPLVHLRRRSTSPCCMLMVTRNTWQDLAWITASSGSGAPRVQ